MQNYAFQRNMRNNLATEFRGTRCSRFRCKCGKCAGYFWHYIRTYYDFIEKYMLRIL